MTSLCYSPNGAHLTVGLASGEVQVFDIDSNSCIFTLEAHKEVSATVKSQSICPPHALISNVNKNDCLSSISSIPLLHLQWCTLKLVGCWQWATGMDRYRYGKVLFSVYATYRGFYIRPVDSQCMIVYQCVMSPFSFPQHTQDLLVHSALRELF